MLLAALAGGAFGAALGALPAFVFTDSLLIGGTFGLLAVLAAELFQRVFYAHSDAYWDPPAAAIVIVSVLIAVLAIASVFPGASSVSRFGL